MTSPTYREMRRQAILRLRKRGMTLGQIGKRYRISRQRVLALAYPKWARLDRSKRELREAVFLRDQHLCQWTAACEDSVDSLVLKERRPLLIVHHIDGNQDNVDMSNLITLCQRCHGRFHARTARKGPYAAINSERGKI